MEPAPPLLYGLAGVAAVAYLGAGVWLATASDRSAGPSDGSFTGDGLPYEDTGLYEDAGDEGRPTAGMVAEQPPDFAPAHLYVDAPGDGFLAMRSQPSVQTGERLDAVPHRGRARVLDVEPVAATIDGIAGRWLYVEHAGTEGWVFDGYLRDAPPA